MTAQKIDNLASLLWDYLKLNQQPIKSDLILCLGSHDLRVAEKASELMLDKMADYVIFSGKLGKITEQLFSKPEAEVFAEVAIKAGVNKDRIIIENQSVNTGQNIAYSYKQVMEKQLKKASVILISAPYMERRAYATFVRQWPDSKTRLAITSPKLSYLEYANTRSSKQLLINLMVGDVQRIKDYPKLGFQINQAIPDQVWAAYLKLVELGFNKYLI